MYLSWTAIVNGVKPLRADNPQNKKGQLGYLQAFSGKLHGENPDQNFAPFIYDRFFIDDFFKKGEKVLNVINAEVESLETDPNNIALKQELAQLEKKIDQHLLEKRQFIKAGKKRRKEQRKEAQLTYLPEDFEKLVTELKRESFREQQEYKQLVTHYEEQAKELREKVSTIKDRIAFLKSRVKPRHQLSRKSDEVPVLTAHRKGRRRGERVPKAAARAELSERMSAMR